MDGNTIIVTGAAGSLGSALARICAEARWNVVMLDIDRRGLERAYDEFVDDGLQEPALYPLDLAGAGPQDYATLLDSISDEFGGLDALVHCAARFEGLTPLEHTAPEEWLMTLQVNLNAPWLLSAQSLALLRQSGAPRLYFMLEDLAAVEGPLWGAYGVSKNALRALVSQFASECRSTGIQVLGINPGPLRSGLRSRAYHLEDPGSQPDPLPLALRIRDYLEGRLEPGGLIVDLSDA